MKIKINWGTGIVIAMAMFMIFILTFVYKSLTPEYTHDLVSDDYYKDELHFQEEIDKLDNALKLKQNIILSNTNKGITIDFPNDKDFNQIKGKINFQKLSNIKLDFSKDINLKSHEVLIADSLLVPGKWIIKIDWSYKGEDYLLKESWFY